MEEGETAKIKVIRDGKKKTLEAKIGKMKIEGRGSIGDIRKFPRFWMPHPYEDPHFRSPYPEHEGASEIKELIDSLNRKIDRIGEKLEELDKTNDKLKKEIEELKDQMGKLRKK